MSRYGLSVDKKLANLHEAHNIQVVDYSVTRRAKMSLHIFFYVHAASNRS